MSDYSGEEHRHMMRRKDDHEAPCQYLTDHLNLERRIFEKLDSIESDIRSTKEIVEIWNSTKGFLSTVQVIGTLAKWVVTVGAALAAIGFAIKQWLKT